MSDSLTFSLPDVGEGLTEAEVVNWRVAVGDPVKINDVLLEIETAKSLVELPSPFAGTVDQLLVEPGETVPVGTALIKVASTAPAIDSSDAASPSKAPEEAQADVKPSVLVGYGPVAAAGRRRKLKNSAPAGSPASIPNQRSPQSQPAKPPLRQLAKKLGVDLASIAGESEGPVTRGQVEMAASLTAPAPVPQESTTPATSPEHETTGVSETRSPIKGVQRAMADAMVRSAFTAPHATMWVSVDMTSTSNLIQKLRSTKGWEHLRITPMLILAKALLLAARRTPLINSSWDEPNQEIVVKHAVNLGIAAATPRGLLVPNIKGADGLGLKELAGALNDLVVAAREGKTSRDDLLDGSITITNIGVFGMEGATPILNPGEAAIVAFGASRPMPWVVDGELTVRSVAQLSLSIDHRLVDGQMGARFLSDIAAILERPEDAILYT